MRFANGSSTSTSYDDYNRFNRYYYGNNFHYESTTDKDKIIKKEEKVHIFDIKDLDLKEE